MTHEEYQANQTRLNELETASNQLAVVIEDGNNQARAFNASVRAAMQKRRAVDQEATLLRQALQQQHEANERAKAEAEAKAATEVGQG